MSERFEPYVRPSVLKPFPDGISLENPETLRGNALAEMGMVDVTAKPFNADPTGQRDSTDAIQRAIVTARNAQMVCFFPAGTYRVSDTLSCIQDLYVRSHGMVSGGRTHPCVLVGSHKGARPKILLAPNSPGFGDPKKPKYVVHFWARALSEGEPTEPQPNISMDQMFVNIDIEIGQGNPGAVAIRHRAAQGSGVQDCTIDATHGLTGLEGGAGSGGGHAGITVIGGRIGLDLRETQPAATISGITLVGQTEAAILYEGRQALSAVGIKIQTKTDGPVIRATAPRWAVHNGQICLIDSEIVFEPSQAAGKPNTAITTDRSLYLENVFVRGADRVVVNSDGSRLAGNPRGWIRVRQYAHDIDPKPWKKLQYRAPLYVDGKRRTNEIADTVVDEAPPKDLQSRHCWEEKFPSFETPGAVNVKDAPYSARGDGDADDTAAIQRVIDENEIVFLPKGYYRVSKTIRLGAKTQLIGVAQNLSIIFARRPEGDFTEAASPHALVQTIDASDAKTILALCGLFVPEEIPGAYTLEWRSGRESICRTVMFRRGALYGHTRNPEGSPRFDMGFPLAVVRGNGGGKWYNFHGTGYTRQTAKYRHLLVEDTHEPLRIYQCNPEHARSDANMEIRNSSNVAIFGLKSEGNYPILRINNSNHVRVYGYGGNAAAFEHTALFCVERSTDYLIANAVDSPRLAGAGSDNHFAGRGVDPALWHMIEERTTDTARILTNPMDRPVLYQRGDPCSNQVW